jgi:hypothetical protein
MTYDDFKNVIEQKPFAPFLVHFADGDVVGVRSPEFVYLLPNRKTVVIASQSAGSIDRIADIGLVTQISIDDGFKSTKPRKKK